MMKTCTCCGDLAEFSFVAIVSSVGISKRVQKCSRALLLCASCLQKRVQTEHSGADELQQAVNSAFTALKNALLERSDASDSVQG